MVQHIRQDDFKKAAIETVYNCTQICDCQKKTLQNTIKTLSKETYREMLGRLIDTVEDFLTEKDIFIPNEERTEELDEVIICGSDYYTLEEKFSVVFGVQAPDKDFQPQDISNEEYQEVINVGNLLPQDERAELWGALVDVVEDFLEEKDITIPNEDREEAIAEGQEDLAIIYGEDYDLLADGFATAIGIDRDSPEMTEER